MTTKPKTTLIVGLGNPGLKYKNTRHNAGFMAIDAFIENHKQEIKSQKEKYNAIITELKFKDRKIIIAKPLIFINNSGKTIKEIIKYWRINIKNLYIIHDDIDLPLGTVRISKNIDSAGHKGVQSIINELKTKNFTRIRIGIRPTETNSYKKIPTDKFVLEKFSKNEKSVIEKAIKKIIEIIEKNIETEIKKTTFSV